MSDAYVAPSLLDCARTQVRVIGALMLRELQSRFGKRDLSLLWVFLEPLVLSGVIGTFHAMWGQHQGMRRVFEFYSMSYLMYYLLRSVMNRGALAVAQNLPLLAHRRVTLHDIFFARHIIEFLTVVMVMLLFQGVLVLAGSEMPVSFVQMMTALIMMLLLAQGLAFLGGGLAARVPTAERVTHVLSYVMLPISGVFWMVDRVPEWVQEIVVWIPMVHLFEFLREGQFGELYRYHYDLEYVFWWIAGLNMLGLLTLSAVRKHLVQE